MKFNCILQGAKQVPEQCGFVSAWFATVVCRTVTLHTPQPLYIVGDLIIHNNLMTIPKTFKVLNLLVYKVSN